MNWNSTAVLESKYDPSVRITIKRFSQGRRAMLELELAPYRVELRDKMLEYAESAQVNEGLRDNDGELVLDENRKAVDPGDTVFVKGQKATRRTAFDQWLQTNLECQIKPATLRTYISKIEGLSVDGQPITTVDKFLAEGPQELADEAYLFISQHGGMMESDLVPKSQSPMPSLEAVDGQMSSTSAVSA